MHYETERLYLKVLEPEAADLVLDYYQRNQSFLKPWEPLRSPEFYTRDYHLNQLMDNQLKMAHGEVFKLWLFKKDNNQRIIGYTGFNNIIHGAFLSCFLGYNMDQDEINQGYMTEALRKGIEIVFNDLKLHRIEANIIPRNKPSLRVVEKLGFTF